MPTTDVPPDTSSLDFDLVGSAERIGMRGLHQTYIAHLYRFMQDVEVNDEVVRRAKIELEKERALHRVFPEEVELNVENYYKGDVLRFTDVELNFLFPDYKHILAEFMRDTPAFDEIGAEKLLRLNPKKYHEVNVERSKGVLEWAKKEALERKKAKKTAAKK